MKKQFFLLFLFVCGLFSAQKLTIDTLLTDDISIRAIQISQGKVWYAGTQSKFGFVDVENPDNKQQISLSEENLQFRTLAQNEDFLFCISIESPAYMFKINKKDLKFKKVFVDEESSAFYDAFIFINNERAFAFSDSDNGKMKLLETQDAGEKWNFSTAFENIPMIKGEAAFAASNSNIAARNGKLWIATGGTTARVFKFDLNKNKSEVFSTPIIQGGSSRGIYSIDFADENFGIAVGGDYTKQKENVNNIATTQDGGKTWQIQASGENGGYMTCVKIKPESQGKEIIALGDQQISYSNDYGKTWKVISNEKNLYVCEWLNSSTLIVAGKDRILKISIE